MVTLLTCLIDQDIKVLVYDVLKKAINQEFNISKKEYILMVNGSIGTTSVVDNHIDSSRSISAFNEMEIDQIDFNDLFERFLHYDDIVQSFIFTRQNSNSITPYHKDMAHTATLDRPESNIFLSRQFGTSRGSFITESLTGGTSNAFKMTSGVLGPTTFARSSDTENSVSENGDQPKKNIASW